MNTSNTAERFTSNVLEKLTKRFERAIGFDVTESFVNSIGV
jgi:hypothetical protein